MKLYLKKNEIPEGEKLPVHGVDYHKGLEDGKTCGVAHEFTTRNCIPLVYTEKDIAEDTDSAPKYVELRHWHFNKTLDGTVK